MKSGWNCMRIALVIALLGAGSALADDVMMATSEDLSAFDAQLGAAQPAGAPRPQGASNGIGQAVSAEAKKIKADAASQAFGRKVRGQAVGHGLGAADDSGAAAAASVGAGGNSTVGKSDPGQGRQNAKNPKK